jgi:HNH endonuclease
MDAATKEFVRRRADHRCEYCRLPADDSLVAPFQIEHIVPKKHDGSDEADNLALACAHCNRHKGPNLAGFDPETGEMSVLFDPRRMNWDDHFRSDGVRVVGVSAIGRTTVRVLNMDSPRRFGIYDD